MQKKRLMPKLKIRNVKDILKNVLVPIVFCVNTIEVNGKQNSLATNVLQNIFKHLQNIISYVAQKKKKN